MAIKEEYVALLGEHFPHCAIYTEQVKQTKREPCFFIKELGSTLARDIGNYYIAQVDMEVRYFPGSGKSYQELESIAASLSQIFYQGLKVKSKVVQSHIDQQVLVMRLHHKYRCYLSKQQVISKMQHLGMASTNLREGVSSNGKQK